MENSVNLSQMSDGKENYSFWTKYKKHATSELLLYGIMILGIVLSLIAFSIFKD
ncbi:hypothetical protein KXQ82_06215 [Mucilaginibacter sp. HMF5004]|uniref:hypothetical protein n=1 Tax=Mucilaginibacter rivuli TaxID=2857527 RepID=UPI001C5EBFEC|nr:hypothetical protein [Mucilaginibacter rivuli]MBW4889300.1 hypothetical protein [Mucilaginibacter rivuli]